MGSHTSPVSSNNEDVSLALSMYIYKDYSDYLKSEVRDRIGLDLEALGNRKDSLKEIVSRVHKFFVAHHGYIRIIDEVFLFIIKNNSLNLSLT